MDNQRTMLNAKRPHFFEIFDSASSSDLLKIPSKFVKHMEGRTCGTVSLVGPSGNTWHINLVHRNNDLLLHEGWAAFVRDHFIEGSDSLVFRYDGNLHFTVQIFDQSSCEKESAFSSVCSQNFTHFNEHMGNKRTRENTISCLDAIFEGVPKKTRGSQAPLESITMAETREAAVYSNDMEKGASLSRTVTYAIPLQSRFSSENSEAIIHRVNKEDGPGSCAGGCMPMLPAPEAERIARSFTSSFPNFMSIMKRFNVSGSYTLNIPCQFSMDHLPNCKLKIVLHNLEGKSWTVNAVPTTRVQTSHTFCGGWVAFVRDNNIDTGDICIFELVRSCELRVQILRVVKEVLDSPSGRPAFKGLTNGNVATSRKKSEKLRKKMNGNSRNAYLQWNSKVNISAAIYNTTSLDDKKGSHTSGCVSLKSAPEEKRAAQAFVSVFPHFVRIMKKFNVSGSYTLKIPYRFSMEHLPNCRTEIILHNLRAECWTVNSVPTTKVQTLHTFCGGWMAFVRGNDIQMGDLCIFELIGKCEMRVHISGVGNKGLDYQSGNAAPSELTLGSFNRNHSR